MITEILSAISSENCSTDGNKDSLLDKQQQVLSLEPTLNRPIKNLKNWHSNNESVTTDEIEYLNREDLSSLLGNNSLSFRFINAINRYIKKKKEGRDNGSVAVLSHSSRQIIRVFQAALTAVLLFAPVIICNFVSNLTYRMIIIVITTAMFIAFLSFIAQKRMKFFDLVIAGTTYVTLHYPCYNQVVFLGKS